MKIEQPINGGDVVPNIVASCIEKIGNTASTKDFIAEVENGKLLHSALLKTELYRWSDVLNRCDSILEDAVTIEKYINFPLGNGNCSRRMKVDVDAEVKRMVVVIIRFTSFLFESTSTRRIYNSTDRLLALLKAADLEIVTEVLRLLQIMSKKFKFLSTKISPLEQSKLTNCLMSIAEACQPYEGQSRIRNLKMSKYVKEDLDVTGVIPFSYIDHQGNIFHFEDCSDPNKSLLDLMDNAPSCTDLNDECRYNVFARLRIIRFFHKQDHRMQCLIVRLLSISTLIYCRFQRHEPQIDALLYSGFVEETTDLIKSDLGIHPLVDLIRTEAFRTLTSIVFVDYYTFRLSPTLDLLGISSYHGYLATFTRQIVEHLKRNELGQPGKPSIVQGTALFSFLYHLSSFDLRVSGKNLVSSGLTQTLLSLLEHKTWPWNRFRLQQDARALLISSQQLM